MGVVVVLVVIVALMAAAGVRAIQIVPVHHMGVVERLGRYKRLVEPGVNVVVPYVEIVRRIDMREQEVAVPADEIMTTDSMIVSVEARLRYKPTDPHKFAYGVADVPLALTRVVETSLRNVIGGKELGEVLSSLYDVNASMLDVLRDAAQEWGAEVTRFELQRPSYRSAWRS